MIHLTEKPGERRTITAREILPRSRFITASGYICGDGQKSMGVTDTDYEFTSGSNASIVTSGLKIVEVSDDVMLSSDDVDEAKAVTSDINGKLKLCATNEAINGHLVATDHNAAYALIKLI